MIANCDELITQFSSVTFIGLAMSKPVHSELDLEKRRQLLPVQNGDRSVKRIAGICQDLAEVPLEELRSQRKPPRFRPIQEWS